MLYSLVHLELLTGESTQHPSMPTSSSIFPLSLPHTPSLKTVMYFQNSNIYQFGNAIGGLTNTAGGIIGAAGRGTGNTVNKTTHTRKGGNGLKDATSGIERGIGKFAKGIERGSVGKRP
jgi:hypothetical protein